MTQLRRLLLLLLITLCLTGCWDRQEVNDIAIVDMVAIDKAPNGLRLTVSVVVPKQASQGEGGGGGKPSTVCYASEGETVMDATAKLQEQLSRRVFWGHTRTLIIGEALARSGVRPVLDFWSRHREPRLRMQIAVTPGNAAAFIKAKPRIERLLSEEVRETIRMHLQTEVTAREFLGWLRSETEEPFAPRVMLVKKSEGSDVKVNGTALFRDDKMIGWLSDAETRGMLWLRGEAQQGVVTVQLPTGGKVSMTLIHGKTSIRPVFQNGELRIKARFEVDDDTYESSAEVDLADPEVVRLLQDRLRDDVADRVKETLKALQQTYGVDVLSFGAQVRRVAPRRWEGGLKERWATEFRRLPVDITVTAHVRRTGEHGAPLGAKRQRVQSQTEKLLKSKEGAR